MSLFSDYDTNAFFEHNESMDVIKSMYSFSNLEV